jgi:hypothetical protein
MYVQKKISDYFDRCPEPEGEEEEQEQELVGSL